MVYRTKANTRRAPTKGYRTTYPRKAAIKAVAKRVVKTALHRQLEHKRIKLSFADLDMGGCVHYAFNPMTTISKGTSEDQRIGDKVSDVRLNLSMQYHHEGQLPLGGVGHQGSIFRVLVIKSRQKLATTVAGWSAQDPAVGVFKSILCEPYHISGSVVNRHECTVIKDFYTRSSYTANQGNIYGVPSLIKFNIPLCKEFRFSDEDPLFSKNQNIYVIVGVSGTGTNSSWTMGNLQCSGYLSWTDA